MDTVTTRIGSDIYCVELPTKRFELWTLFAMTLTQQSRLDASGSVSDVDWRESLLFARDLAVQLNTSVPQFRAGLGQPLCMQIPSARRSLGCGGRLLHMARYRLFGPVRVHQGPLPLPRPKSRLLEVWD